MSCTRFLPLWWFETFEYLYFVRHAPASEFIVLYKAIRVKIDSCVFGRSPTSGWREGHPKCRGRLKQECVWCVLAHILCKIFVQDYV